MNKRGVRLQSRVQSPPMRSTLRQIALMCACLTGVAAAGPTTRESIDQLHSDDPIVRQSAEDHLADLGSPALESLRSALADPNPETHARVRRALRRIELFRQKQIPSAQLSIANEYLNAHDYDAKKLQLNRLFDQPSPEAALTRLITIETDPDFRHQMFYKLYLGYRDQAGRILQEDDDLDAMLDLVDGAGTMWGQKQSADNALLQYLSGHLDEQIARWTAEQTNGTQADQERAADILCQLYRVCGKYDQALKFARLSREPSLVFMVFQDQGDWKSAAAEPDDRWHDPTLAAAFHAAFLRLAGHPAEAVDALSQRISAVVPDTDSTMSPSKLFLLNDLPETGINLLLPNHPAIAFSMRVERREIAQAIEIAEKYKNNSPDSTLLSEEYTALRQRLGVIPAPATQPVPQAEENSPQWKQWVAAVKELDDKQFTAAAGHFAALWAADHSKPDRLYLQGYALKQAGNTEHGQRLMHVAEMIPLGDPRVRWEMANMLDSAGLNDVADQQRELGLHSGGDFDELGFSEIWNTRVVHAIEQKNWKQAADALDRLCLINLSSGVQWHDPVNYLLKPAEAHLYKARAAQQAGDAATAMQEAKRFGLYLPGSSDLAIALVPMLDKAGDHAGADALFIPAFDRLSEIVKQYPNSRTYLNELAWTSACCNRRLDEALAAATRAVDLDPTDYQTIDTLAEVHFRRGERRAAITIEQSAIRRSNDPYLQRQLQRFENGPVPSTTRPVPAPE
jgi:tetratricopeptide (TPR) repeat protein